MNIIAFFKRISPRALSLAILHVGGSTVLIYLISLLFILYSNTLPGYILSHIFTPTLEHIMMSAAIIFVGAFLLELSDTQKNARL